MRSAVFLASWSMPVLLASSLNAVKIGELPAHANPACAQQRNRPDAPDVRRSAGRICLRGLANLATTAPGVTGQNPPYIADLRHNRRAHLVQCRNIRA